MYDYSKILGGPERDEAFEAYAKNHIETYSFVSALKFLWPALWMLWLVLYGFQSGFDGGVFLLMLPAIARFAYLGLHLGPQLRMMKDGAVFTQATEPFPLLSASSGRLRPEDWRQVSWDDIESVDGRNGKLKFSFANNSAGLPNPFEITTLSKERIGEILEKLQIHQKRGDVSERVTLFSDDGSQAWKKGAIALGAMAIAGVLLASSDGFKTFMSNAVQSAASDAKCVLSGTSANEDAYLINNESDYGITVTTNVKNEGGSGHIKLIAKLMTSEGTYQHEREANLEKGEVRKFSIQFPEPTVNATDIQYQVRCL